MYIKRYFGSLILLISLFMLVAGCAMNSKPLFVDYDEEGEPMMNKRYRRHIVRDFKIRWRQKAYNKNNSTGPHFLLSDDQKAIKKDYGPPDYISRTYLSRKGDYVKEWLYWDEGFMFQFVRRNIVYEGPLKDKERILVLYGFPDDARAYQLGEGIERENFYYYSLFGFTQSCYHFVNGKCIDKLYLQ